MLRFSGEQLSFIQAALAAPVPPMVPPPQLVPVVMTAAPPHGTPLPPAPPRHYSHLQGRAAPQPPDPGGPRGQTLIPLSVLLPSYLGLVAAAIAACILPAAPHPLALPLGSTWLALTVALHALAVPHSPAAQALGALVALLAPAACCLMWPEGGLAAGLALSLFLALSVPARCGRRAFSLLGLALVVAGASLAPVLSATPSGARSVLGIALTGLALQAVVGAGRLRAGSLRASAADKPEQNPRPSPAAIGL